MNNHPEDTCQTSQPPPLCPVGERDCPLVAEVTQLRYDLTDLSMLVRTDTLTGIANFRYFVQALPSGACNQLH